MKTQRESKKYGSTLSWTSALDRGGWVNTTPLPLYSREKDPVSIRLVREISPPPEFHPRTVQPVASRYTDLVTPAHDVSYFHLLPPLSFDTDEFINASVLSAAKSWH